MGLRVWVVYEQQGGITPFAVDFRVKSFRRLLPADPPGPNQRRKKHLVQLWTDPGGMRTLTVGSIRLQDPHKTGEIKAVPKRVSEDMVSVEH